LSIPARPEPPGGVEQAAQLMATASIVSKNRIPGPFYDNLKINASMPQCITTVTTPAPNRAQAAMR